MNKIKQMKLKKFTEEYDIPRTTILSWIHAVGFPAYRLHGHWYIDIEQFYRWRTEEHEKSYKYSDIDKNRSMCYYSFTSPMHAVKD